MKRPQVIKAGKYPDCIHHEHINGDLIGTCSKCGQVRAYGAYGDAGIVDLDPATKSFGTMTSEEVQEKRAKGGQATNRRGSINEGSAAWVGVTPKAKLAYTKRGTGPLKVLRKGVDF